jgi:hypothetical protein
MIKLKTISNMSLTGTTYIALSTKLAVKCIHKKALSPMFKANVQIKLVETILTLFTKREARKAVLI